MITADITDGLELRVRDTGIGISPEDFARILMPFGQINSPYSRKHPGAGLGLTLTKALIECHGGRLRINSTPKVGWFPAERVMHISPEPEASKVRAA